MTTIDSELATEAGELQLAWCAAVDMHDLDAIQGLFAEGGTFLTRGTLMDAAARAEFFPGIWLADPSRSTHVCRDVRAEQDSGQIAVRARLTATFVLPDGTVRVAWGHYDDVVTRTDKGLRFVAKRITLERVETLPEAASA